LRELPTLGSTAEGSSFFELAERLTEALVVDTHSAAELDAGQRPWGLAQEIDQAFGKSRGR